MQLGIKILTELDKQHHTIYTNSAVQSQKALSAYFTSKQILPFAFAEQNGCYYAFNPSTAKLLYWNFTYLKYCVSLSRSTTPCEQRSTILN